MMAVNGVLWQKGNYLLKAGWACYYKDYTQELASSLNE